MLRNLFVCIALSFGLSSFDPPFAQTNYGQCSRDQRSCNSSCRDDKCVRRCFLEAQGCNNRVSIYLREEREADRRRQQQRDSASTARDSYSPPPRTMPLAQGSSCPQNLASLSPRLANYADPELRSLRSTILNLNINDVMQNARGMGYSPAAAARLSLQQAESDEAALPQAEACIRSSSNNPAGAIQSLRNGTFAFDNASIPSACAKGYVVAYWGALANRETASAMACLAATMR